MGLIDVEELMNLHRGQGLDLFWRDSLTCPSEEEYIHMVLGSTSPCHHLTEHASSTSMTSVT